MDEESEIKKAASDLVDSFQGICDGLLRPMSEQFTRYRIKEIEDKLNDLSKEVARMYSKILDLERKKNE